LEVLGTKRLEACGAIGGGRVVRGVIPRSSGRLRRELSIEPPRQRSGESQGSRSSSGRRRGKMWPPRALYSSRIYFLARLKYSHT